MPCEAAVDWGQRKRDAHTQPRVIIIGAGVSGMATGAYAQMNGMDSRIFEAYVLPGGCCTAWERKGYTFDYCIEWLIGTGEGNDANRIWLELGALDGKTVRDFDMFNRVVGEDGRAVNFYNDPDRSEARSSIAHGVEQILVEDGRAIGIQLKDGSRHYADYVVSACDGRSVIYGLLGGKYVNATIEKLYQDMLYRPGILYPGVVSAFVGFEGDVDPDAVHSTTYLLSSQDAAELPCALQRSLVVQLRSRYSERKASRRPGIR